MGYDEFYKGKEYKGASEHVLFRIEILSNKENVFLNENKSVKEENTTLRENQPTETGKYKKKTNKQNNDSQDSDINTASNTTSTATSSTATSNIISTTSYAAAGVVAVAAISIVMATPPIIELLDFNVGSDYLAYKIETSDFVDGINYFVEIEDNDNFHYSKQIETVGIFEDIVNGLTPNTYYSYKFIGYDSSSESKVYLEKTFFTEMNYLATFNKLSIEESTIRWTYNYDEINDTYEDIYRIIIPTQFKNDTEYDYQYRVTLFNENGLNEVYQGTDSEIVFEFPRTHTTASLKYESLVITNGVERVCDTFISEPYTFEIGFTINEIGIDYYYSTGLIDITMHAPEDYEIRYYTSINPEVKSLYSGKSPIDYPSEESIYYFYMVNGNEEVVSEVIEYTLKTIETVDSTFNYLNPGEITITYNDNGSINAYLDTQFECSDKDVYYDVQFINEGYRNVIYTTQSRYASIEDFNIFSDMGVIYYVYKMVDGIKHCFKSVTPSGTLTINDVEGQQQSYIDTSTNPATFNFSHYDKFKFDKSSMYLILDNGERLNILEDQFIIDEYNNASLTLDLPEGVEKATMHVLASTTYNNYDIYKEIEEFNLKGNCYKELVVEL